MPIADDAMLTHWLTANPGAGVKASDRLLAWSSAACSASQAIKSQLFDVIMSFAPVARGYGESWHEGLVM